MNLLRFRCPGRALDARSLVARALAGARDADAAELVAGGRLRAETPGGSRVGPALTGRVAPGTACRLELPGEGGSELAVRELGGPLVILVPAWPWPRGIGRRAGQRFAFACEEERDAVVALRVDVPAGAGAKVLDWLAAAGAPALGDARRGGVLVAGGLRMAAAHAPPPPGFWPREPVFAPDATVGSARPALRVSAATLRILRRGHPWVLRDEETGDPRAFAPGALVQLRGPRGEDAGLVLTEGDGVIVARRWDARARTPREAPSVEARVAAALARRRPLLDAARTPGGTDALRLVHGEADGLPGLAVDRLGPVLRVLVSGRSALPLRARVVAALCRALAPELGTDPPVVEVLHLAERPEGEVESVRRIAGPWPPPGAEGGALVVREGALCLRVEPGLAEPTRARPGVGLFLDQRENRARLAARTRACGRYLNLFAHTGAFSAALLAGGAGEVTSVDLSAPTLAWLEENLVRSGLSCARHRSVRREARRFLAELPRDARFDGIVLDPPTSAAAGRRFFSVRQDLLPLAARTLAHLAPGGWLFVSRHQRRGRGGLRRMLGEAARQAGVTLAALESAPPAADFPALRGFPEGDPFEALLATRAPSGVRSSS
jgi:23S rRNA (cytosine1962-C5)-methyltransferase